MRLADLSEDSVRLASELLVTFGVGLTLLS